MTDNKTQPAKEREGNAWGRFALIAAVTAAVAAAVVVTMKSNQSDHSPKANQNANASMSSAPLAPDNSAPTPATELVTMDVAKAVMVTVELDFGPKTPTIAEALNQVERRYQPDDGQGRAFAVLDAYGEKLPDGKLHISMHVSSEKPGGAQLVFKRTGEVLWRGKINPMSQPLPPKNLTILIDSGKGTTYTVDGSSNPASIIDAKVKPGDLPVKDVWPDGESRELTFIYSACGCPVKVLIKREGDGPPRAK